jgi:hypothetical protein
MIDAVESISGTSTIYPLRESFPQDKKPVDKPEKAPESKVPEDTVELSPRPEKTAPASEQSHQSSSDVKAEDARLVSEEWYRYGFESAYSI